MDALAAELAAVPREEIAEQIAPSRARTDRLRERRRLQTAREDRQARSRVRRAADRVSLCRFRVLRPEGAPAADAGMGRSQIGFPVGRQRRAGQLLHRRRAARARSFASSRFRRQRRDDRPPCGARRGPCFARARRNAPRARGRSLHASPRIPAGLALRKYAARSATRCRCCAKETRCASGAGRSSAERSRQFRLFRSR